MKLSTEYRRRVEQALQQTKDILAQQLQHREGRGLTIGEESLMDFYRSHIAKLERYLETGETDL